jgi:DNA (cytosine-5)-methyltransferase 1
MRVLDAFSCAGGAAAGYMQAGADVTAVDLDAKALDQNPAPRKVVGDAIAYVREHGHEYDLIHGSPPCQRWAAHGFREGWPDLIGPFRQACLEVGIPYVIENVHSARRELIDPVTLCGTMFGLIAWDDDGTLLYLQRHRMFETNWGLEHHLPIHAHPKGVQWAGAYGGARRDKVEARTIRKGGYVPANLDVIRTLLGTRWITTERYLFEAIPPRYTKHIAQVFARQMAAAA